MNAPVDASTRQRNRLVLVLILVLFFGSLLLAGILRFSGWRPEGMKNHGELLEPPADLRDLTPALVEGGSYAWNPVARTWRVLVPAPADCDAACLGVLAQIDKVWQLMGKDADRLDVLWLCARPGCEYPAAPARPATLRRLEPDAALRARLPRLQPAGNGLTAYVVDPNGFVILRYAPGFDPGGLRSDVAKLIKLK